MPFTTDTELLSTGQPARLSRPPRFVPSVQRPSFSELAPAIYRRSWGESLKGLNSLLATGSLTDQSHLWFDPTQYISEDMQPWIDEYYRAANPQDVESITHALRQQAQDYETIGRSSWLGKLAFVGANAVDPTLLPLAFTPLFRVGQAAHKAGRFAAFLKRMEQVSQAAQKAQVAGNAAEFIKLNNASRIAGEMAEWMTKAGVEYPSLLKSMATYGAQGAGLTALSEALQQQGPNLRTWSDSAQDVLLSGVASSVIGPALESFGRLRIRKFKERLKNDFNHTFSGMESDAPFQPGPVQERLPGIQPKATNEAAATLQDYLEELQATVYKGVEEGSIAPDDARGIFTQAGIAPDESRLVIRAKTPTETTAAPTQTTERTTEPIFPLFEDPLIQTMEPAGEKRATPQAVTEPVTAPTPQKTAAVAPDATISTPAEPQSAPTVAPALKPITAQQVESDVSRLEKFSQGLIDYAAQAASQGNAEALAKTLDSEIGRIHQRLLSLNPSVIRGAGMQQGQVGSQEVKFFDYGPVDFTEEELHVPNNVDPEEFLREKRLEYSRLRRQHTKYQQLRAYLEAKKSEPVIPVRETSSVPTVGLQGQAGVTPSELSSIALQINFPVSSQSRQGFIQASENQSIYRLAQKFGIREIAVDPPYTFDLSQEGAVTVRGTVRINANVQDAEDTILHELAHVAERNMDNAERAKAKALVEKYREAIRAQAPGYVNNFDEGWAELFSQQNPEALELALSVNKTDWVARQKSQQPISVPSVTQKPAEQIVPNTWAEFIEQKASHFGDVWLQESDPIEALIQKDGDRSLNVEDVNGGHHHIPASQFIELSKNPLFSGNVKGVLLMRGTEMSPPRYDNYTLQYLPDMKKAIQEAGYWPGLKQGEAQAIQSDIQAAREVLTPAEIRKAVKQTAKVAPEIQAVLPDETPKSGNEYLADEVRAIAQNSQTGRFGPNKVFLNHLWRQYQEKHPSTKLTLESFKEKLLELSREGLVALSRADLQEAMDPADVKASHVENFVSGISAGTFNFIRTDFEPKAKKGTPAPVTPPVVKKELKPLEYRKGNRAVFYLPGDKAPIESEYAIVELKKLVVSHDKNYAANPDFPSELQPRDRDRSANKTQVEEIAGILNPALLGESASATMGAPIVGPDGIVESGNGRVMAIRKVQGRPQGDEYRNWLKENAEKFGFVPSDLSGMKSPVLIRVRLTDVNRPEFVKKANASETARLSPAEQAKADAEQILIPSVLGTLVVDEEGNIPARSNLEFSRAFLRNVPASEMNEYLTAEGYATEKLNSRMTAALFEKPYGDKDLLALVSEATQDNDIRNLTKALTSAAVPFIKAAGVDKSGDVKRLIDAAISAVHLVRYSRRNNIPLRNVLSQENAFEQIREETSLLAQQIEHLKRSSAKLGEFFNHLAREMYNRETHQGNLSLFEDDTPLSFVELIKKFITIPTVTYGQETTQSDTSLFGPADPSGGSGQSEIPGRTPDPDPGRIAPKPAKPQSKRRNRR